jgi:outer membrane protein TolC
MTFTKEKCVWLAAPLIISISGCSITPEVLNNAQLSAIADNQSSRILAQGEPVTAPISLCEAMARALKYNLDDQVEVMQQSLKSAEASLAAGSLWPQMVSSSGYSGRDSFLTVTSLDVPTGTIVKPNTVSQDKQYNSADVTFSWNILDFALSYVRARQASNRFLIAVETRRRIVQHIVEDTRTAYWRAVSADRMSRKLARLQKRVRGAIAGAHTATASAAEGPLTAMTTVRELTQILQTAEQLQHELNLAKSQLAALMSLPPGVNFVLADAKVAAAPAMFEMPAKEMVAEAIFNRSEIREVAYQQRITADDATAALLELLPGIKDYAGSNFDSNHFLYAGNWLSFGTTVAGNLVKIVQLPAKQASVEAAAEILKQKSLAITMTVMSQVFVSRTRYQHFSQELATAEDYLDIQAKLVQQMRGQSAIGNIGDQSLIREEMNAIVAEARRDIAYANLQSASANLVVSMGLDLRTEEVNLALDTRTLADRLKSAWSDRSAISDRGKYLLELEKAKTEALRKRDEAAQAAREEAKRARNEDKKSRDEMRQSKSADAAQNSNAGESTPLVWYLRWLMPATAQLKRQASRPSHNHKQMRVRARATPVRGPVH